MEALHAAHGGQALDLEIIDVAPGNTSVVYGNDQRFADTQFVAISGGSVAISAAKAVQGLQCDIAVGDGAQDTADAATELIIANGVGTDDAYNGQTLRVYDSVANPPSLANAKSLTGSNSPHKPVGFKDHVISDYDESDGLLTFSPALAMGVPKTIHDGDTYGGADKLEGFSAEILPGIKVTGSALVTSGTVMAISARLAVPQL
jgi:hypothetical protein